MLATRIPGGGYRAVVNLAQSGNAVASGMVGVGLNSLTPVGLGGYSNDCGNSLGLSC